MPARQTKAEKAIDQEIERLYYKNAQGVQIDIMDIGKVFKAGHAAHAAGLDMEAAIVLTVTALRKN